MKVGEAVADMANRLIAQAEDGADGTQLEKATEEILAEWRTNVDDDRRYVGLLRKLTDHLLEQREAYSRRAAKRSKSGDQSAADQLQNWAETINAAIQALRDRRAELKSHRAMEQALPHPRPRIGRP